MMYYSSPLIVQRGDRVRYSEFYHRPDLQVTGERRIRITDEDITAMKKFFATGEKTK